MYFHLFLAKNQNTNALVLSVWDIAIHKTNLWIAIHKTRSYSQNKSEKATLLLGGKQNKH